MSKLITTSELIFLQVSEESKEDLLHKICSKVEEKGYITTEFAEDLIRREIEFPTGLDTPIPIAIPHIGTNCRDSFFSMTTLKDPVEFENMDGSETMIPARIVFLFGIVEPEEQVKVLRKLSAMFRNRSFLDSLYKSSDPEEALKYLEDILGEMIDIK